MAWSRSHRCSGTERTPARRFRVPGFSNRLVGLLEAISNITSGFVNLRRQMKSGTIAAALQLPIREPERVFRALDRLSPDQQVLLAADYRAGKTIYELAREYGVHRHTVTEHLNRAGVASRRTITEAERARFRELHAQGLGTYVIAKRLGRDPGTVRRMLSEA